VDEKCAPVEWLICKGYWEGHVPINSYFYADGESCSRSAFSGTYRK
jgi:hypothetical protein